MRNAHLWKRILNEGLRFADDDAGEDAERFISSIVTAPIIVDTRPGRSESAVFTGIVFPYPQCWIEGFCWVGLASGGCYVHSNRGIDGWAVRFTSVIATNHLPPTCTGEYLLRCDPAGDADPLSARTMLWGGGLTEAVGDDTMGIVTTAIAHAAIETLVLLGCKNVSLSPSEVEPSQARRAAKRFGGTADNYRYHTLVMRPPGARSDSPAQDIGVMPRHVCRGHFADYGPEFGKGLLFGKYAGRFYIPPHLKGDKKNGVVEKDYAIV